MQQTPGYQHSCDAHHLCRMDDPLPELAYPGGSCFQEDPHPLTKDFTHFPVTASHSLGYRFKLPWISLCKDLQGCGWSSSRTSEQHILVPRCHHLRNKVRRTARCCCFANAHHESPRGVNHRLYTLLTHHEPHRSPRRAGPYQLLPNPTNLVSYCLSPQLTSVTTSDAGC